MARYPSQVQWLVPLLFMLLPIAALALLMVVTLTIAESDIVDRSGWTVAAILSLALLVAVPEGRQILRLLVRPSEAAVAAYLGAQVSLASSGPTLAAAHGQAEDRILASIAVLFVLGTGDALLGRRASRGLADRPGVRRHADHAVGRQRTLAAVSCRQRGPLCVLEQELWHVGRPMIVGSTDRLGGQADLVSTGGQVQSGPT